MTSVTPILPSSGMARGEDPGPRRYPRWAGAAAALVAAVLLAAVPAADGWAAGKSTDRKAVDRKAADRKAAERDGSETLESALGQAYMTNPTLDAARAQLRAVDEQVPQALSGQRPTVQAVGSAGQSWNDTYLTRDWQRTDPRSLSLQATQPIYRGGSIEAGIKRAENLVQSQRASLLNQEQEVLRATATAYLDVVRDQAVVDLNINNEQVLRRQLEATQDRFRVGEITKTDVSQGEARLARSTAERVLAEGNLRTSRSTYARLVGAPPAKLKAPKITYPLPSTIDEAMIQAQNNNPAVVAAVFAEAAARNSVDAVDGELWPQASLTASLSKSDEQSTNIDNTSSGRLLAQVTIPLYTSGSVAARAREARQTAGQRRLQIDEAHRQARDGAIKAWEALTTSRASIKSRRAEIRSNEIALEGVRQEATVGTRTVLDTLNAEQELLDARVNLVRDSRDEAVATFNLLAAIGRLTAQELKLAVEYYDYQAYYRSVRDRWWGTGADD